MTDLADSDTLAAPFDVFVIADDDDAVTTGRELSTTRSKLGDLLDLLPAGLLIHQEQGIVYANDEAGRILGVEPWSLVGRHYLDFIGEDEVDRHKAAFLGCLHDKTLTRNADAVVTGGDGHRVNLHVSMSPLPWQGLPVIYIVLSDVTALQETTEILRRLSVTDSLTGISNRRHFLELAEREVTRGRRYTHPVSLLLLDIDHFKRINDTYGHAVGDEALRAFTRACLASLRTTDVLGRLGGEEFAVLLPETGMPAASQVAERIRREVAAVVVDAHGEAVRFTVSIGAATWQGGAPSVDALISCADEALYRAKGRGRNRVVCAADVPVL
jgi:diguanylate cyclase (GGDEF)-like protein/PAS domain S-box-containing protein